MNVQDHLLVHGKIEPIDILAIGPHPDDIEIGAAGSLLKWIEAGQTVGLVDLTQGEIGTKGTGEERIAESKEAANRLGAAFRANLGLTDGSVADDLSSRERLVRVIRQSKPKWVLSNLEEDHHPDHTAGARLVKSAYFLARLPKFLDSLSPHSPEGLFYYLIHSFDPPTFLVDTSAFFEKKIETLSAYTTQFIDPKLPENYRHTGISDYLKSVRTLGEAWGIQAGCDSAEAFIADKPLILEDLTHAGKRAK